jgi:hypothetical protein
MVTLAATLFLSIVRCISYCMIDQSIPDAGMVGTKDVPTIQTGSGKCRHVDRKRSYVHSQGMTLIYRWDVFERLGFPFKIKTHRHELGNLRANIFNAFTRKTSSERRCALSGGKDPSNDHDDLENITGVHFVDTVKANVFGPPALFLHTPLSSHFPWIEWSQRNHTECSRERWQAVVANATQGNLMSGDLDYIYTNLHNVGNLSLLEACRSNTYFLQSQQAWTNGSKTCDEVHATYTALEEKS